MSGILHQRAVLLAKPESTYNTDSVPTPAANAVLVEDPEFSIDPNVLERNFARPSLSSLPHQVGRKIASIQFMVEAGSNGVTNAGADPATLGTLLRACGFAETLIGSSSAGVQAVKPMPGAQKDVSWASGGDETITEPIRYVIEVTTAGASGVAEVSITPDANAVANLSQVAQTGVTVTSGAALDLKSGGSGFTATPTFTGTLPLGAKWYVMCYPTGVLYSPISENFESATLYLYFDGLFHKLTGGRGTVSFEATAGEYGKFTFNFTGQYVDPVDASMPSNPLFDQNSPPVFEEARLYLGDFAGVVNSLSWDISNDISPRMDANNSDGYNGCRITGREPTGSVDPEAALVASEDFWRRMKDADQMYVRCRLGAVAGNRLFFLMPGVQYSGLSYTDRDNIRSFDASTALKQVAGDDELFVFFS